MSWRTTRTDDNIVHVIPLGDDQEHYEEVVMVSLPDANLFDEAPVSGCPCGARREASKNGGWIIIHNSFDGREGLEWANQILK